MPNVTLFDYTGKGRVDERWHAAHVLMFTKSTRLNMDPGLFEKIQNMTEKEKRAELEYMASTIPSSWEFVNLTFLITGVTRATAQQITRTRTASYAMQSQRVTDLSDCGITNPFPEDSDLWHEFQDSSDKALESYGDLVSLGAKKEDARGILPLNVQTNLVANYNLRTLSDLISARKSLRAQGEFASIARQMESLTLSVWPWAAPFFESRYDRAIEMLEGVVRDLGLTVGSGPGWEIAKVIDLLRKA